jgi:hypothetical protein
MGVYWAERDRVALTAADPDWSGGGHDDRQVVPSTAHGKQERPPAVLRRQPVNGMSGSGWAVPPPRQPAPARAEGDEWQAVVLRLLAAAAILGPWLLLLTSWQVALYPTGETLPTAMMPAWPVLVAMGAAILVRVRWPSPRTHLLALAILVGGVAALAANPGSPLPSAVGDLCSASCRDGIAGRFMSFYGWPIAVFVVLGWRARIERGSPDPVTRACWTWTWAWAIAALVLGLWAALNWWHIILPKG